MHLRSSSASRASGARSPRARAPGHGRRRGSAVRRLELAPARALSSLRRDEPGRLHRWTGAVRRQGRSRDDQAVRAARVVVRPRRDLRPHLPARDRGIPADRRIADVLRRHIVRESRGRHLRALLLRRPRRLGSRADAPTSRRRGESRSTRREIGPFPRTATCSSASTRTFSATSRSFSTASGSSSRTAPAGNRTTIA